MNIALYLLSIVLRFVYFCSILSRPKVEYSASNSFSETEDTTNNYFLKDRL